MFPALEQLREGYALGVLTNGPRPESVLRRMGFAHYFDSIVTVFGGTKKPAGVAFEGALDALGAEPATTAHVGDSLIADVQGALSAGLTPIWIDRFGDGNPLPRVRIASSRWRSCPLCSSHSPRRSRSGRSPGRLRR